VGMLRAWDKSIHYLRKYPQEAVHIIAQASQADEPALRLSLQGLRLLDLSESLTMMQQDLPSLVTTALQLLHSPSDPGHLDLAQFIDTQPVVEALAQSHASKAAMSGEQ
jgi:ABC-type nitrate/sulfonate/bicarbonate transport system substrate-binding protein